MNSSHSTSLSSASPSASTPAEKDGNGDGARRLRIWAPKARTGCITCKVRRVKCDELKPHCKKCTSTGRKCDGYAEPKPKPGKTPRSNRNRVESSPHKKIPYMAYDIEGSHDERRSFHYFRSRNISAMPGNFEPHFWGQLVLQISHQDPTIRYPLLALSAIYEEYDRGQQDAMKVPSSQSQSPYVLRLYTKALGLLSHSLLTGQADPRATLISCLIFMWIEFLQDNLDAGFKHLESGMRILKNLEDKKHLSGTGSPFPNDVEDIYGSLDRSFRRLNIQASMHGRVTSSFDPISIRNPWEITGSLPTVFCNIFESRNYLDDQLSSVFACMRQVRNSDRFGTDCDQSPDLLSLDLICQAFLDRLKQWQEATANMVMANSALYADEHSLAIKYLQLYYTVMAIVLRTPFAASEMVFDSYTAEFESILLLAESLLNGSCTTRSQVLSFDMGVIPPLFFLVMKCRDSRLRRKALALLKRAPEQEGLWRRAAVVGYSEWKIEVEEQGLHLSPESSIVSESARIYQEHITYECRDGNPVAMIRFRRSGTNSGELSESVELTQELEIAMGMGDIL